MYYRRLLYLLALLLWGSCGEWSPNREPQRPIDGLRPRNQIPKNVIIAGNVHSQSGKDVQGARVRVFHDELQKVNIDDEFDMGADTTQENGSFYIDTGRTLADKPIWRVRVEHPDYEPQEMEWRELTRAEEEAGKEPFLDIILQPKKRKKTR